MAETQFHFYVSRNGQQEGPLSLETIKEKILQKYFLAQDHIYDSEKNEWISLNIFSKTSEAFTETYVRENAKDYDVEKWYILRGENKFGPYAFIDLVQMLQEKNLYEYDYVWNDKMATWSRVADCIEFSTAQLKELKDSENPNLNQVFFRRRFDRAKFESSIIIHNNIKVWKAQSFTVSVGGLGILVENTQFSQGDEIFLHFKAGAEVPPFNAQCEVVNVHTNVENGISTQQLGLRFLKVNYLIQKVIKDFVTKVNSQTAA